MRLYLPSQHSQWGRIARNNRCFINEIWGYDSDSGVRTVDTHIKRLRDKVESGNFKIVTVRGLGYKVVLL